MGSDKGVPRRVRHRGIIDDVTLASSFGFRCINQLPSTFLFLLFSSYVPPLGASMESKDF